MTTASRHRWNGLHVAGWMALGATLGVLAYHLLTSGKSEEPHRAIPRPKPSIASAKPSVTALAESGRLWQWLAENHRDPAALKKAWAQADLPTKKLLVSMWADADPVALFLHLKEQCLLAETQPEGLFDGPSRIAHDSLRLAARGWPATLLRKAGNCSWPHRRSL